MTEQTQTEIEYRSDFQLGHTEGGQIALGVRCGSVAASVILGPEGAAELGQNLCRMASQVNPTVPTLHMVEGT